MLQIILDDDEHTAEIGPYVRLLKNRKWLLLSAAALNAIIWGLYDPAAAKAMLRVLSVPAIALEATFGFGLLYAVIQNILLLLQLRTIYDMVLADRFSKRRADDRAMVTDRLRKAQAQLKEANERDEANRRLRRRDLTQLISQARSRANIARKEFTARSITQQFEAVPEYIKAADEEVEKLEEALARVDNPSLNGLPAEAHPARAEIERASQEMTDLWKDSPAARSGYEALEKALDVLRLAPVLLIGIASLVLLAVRLFR